MLLLTNVSAIIW